jgi:diaminopimelate epimerase
MAEGRGFWKMTGSGNDFVFMDGRSGDTGAFEDAAEIRRICARGTGVGADGLVILATPDRGVEADLAIRYYNSDGSAAALCGNATLCTVSLGARIGAIQPGGFGLQTGSGVVRARMAAGLPEFDLPGVDEIQASLAAIAPAAGERRIGFARAGIPHVVIRVADVDAADVMGRGRYVRQHESLAEGANVNFVGPRSGGGWRIRTYERGVEGETLACGTGTVASAVLLRLWGEAGDDVELETASGRMLGVRSSRQGDAGDGVWSASLRGEGRLVYEGILREL